jgi:hypothetical protein
MDAGRRQRLALLWVHTRGACVAGTRISRYIVSKREGSELSGHNMHAVVVPVTPPPEEEALICTVAVHDMIGTKKREGW